MKKLDAGRGRSASDIFALRILTNCPEFETAENKQKDKI